MTGIEEIASRRGIAEIVHFTTNKGLIGILATGAVLPRERLSKEEYLKYIYTPNAEIRRDMDWLGHVNLSISRINTEFFGHSLGWHPDDDVWWCALAFDPAILSDDGVFFATTNNIYTGCQRESGPTGLEALFAERVRRWGGQTVTRKTEMPDNLPTCHQAEVLYPGDLNLDRLIKIYVATGAHADIVASNRDIFLARKGSAEREIPIVINADVFQP